MSRSRDVSDSNISGASGFDAGTVGYAMLIYLPLWDFLIVPYFVVKLLLDASLDLLVCLLYTISSMGLESDGCPHCSLLFFRRICPLRLRLSPASMGRK
jgi:hypothetical protein